MRYGFPFVFRALPVLAAILIAGAGSPAFAQNGLTVIDSLNVRHGGPGPSYGFYYAACWGYVAPDGHEYAILGCYGGTSIIDLETTPVREVAFIPGANNEWKEMKTWGHYLYAVSEGSSQGFQIINLSQLPDTAWLERTVTSVNGRNISRSHTITVADDHVYLSGATAGGQTGGALILSIADPANPVYVGEYQATYFHDVYVRSDTLYAAALGAGVYIASVVNKASPVQIGRITYTGAGTHNTWTSPDGRYLYTSDEVGTTAKNMKVYDISNLPSVTPLTPFTPSPTTTIHNVHGRGGYAYISHYKAGVFVADVRDPANILNVGWYNTYRGGGLHSQYAGCWDVYPYFPSGRIIASDTQTGLYVLRFNGLAPRIRSPLLAPANGDTLRRGTGTPFRWRRAASPAADPHYYQLHVWGPGVDTIMRTRDTSLVLSALDGAQNGQSYSWHVWIRDEYTRVSSQDTLRFVYIDTGVGVEPSPVVPAYFALGQNFPNPFNPSTTITYTVPVAGRVTITLFNLLGQEVGTILDAVRGPGSYRVAFDAGELPSGVYLYRMKAESGFQETRKMVLLR